MTEVIRESAKILFNPENSNSMTISRSDKCPCESREKYKVIWRNIIIMYA